MRMMIITTRIAAFDWIGVSTADITPSSDESPRAAIRVPPRLPNPPMITTIKARSTTSFPIR